MQSFSYLFGTLPTVTWATQLVYCATRGKYVDAPPPPLGGKAEVPLYIINETNFNLLRNFLEKLTDLTKCTAYRDEKRKATTYQHIKSKIFYVT